MLADDLPAPSPTSPITLCCAGRWTSFARRQLKKTAIFRRASAGWIAGLRAIELDNAPSLSLLRALLSTRRRENRRPYLARVGDLGGRVVHRLFCDHKTCWAPSWSNSLDVGNSAQIRTTRRQI